MRRLAALAAFVVATTASAQTADRGISVGNGFYQRCKAPVDRFAEASCVAYARGLSDGIISGISLACIPPAVTYQQILDILLKYLTDVPAARHMEMHGIFNVAMYVAFPCPRDGLPPTVEIDPPKR